MVQLWFYVLRIVTKGSVLHPITPYTARRVGNTAQTWHALQCSRHAPMSIYKWVGCKSLTENVFIQFSLNNFLRWIGFALEVAEEAGAGEVHRYLLVPPWVFHLSHWTSHESAKSRDRVRERRARHGWISGSGMDGNGLAIPLLVGD